MTDEPLDDRRASELLRKLEQDRTQKSARRDEIRAQVLDHYDQLHDVDDESREPDDLIVEMGPAPVVEVPVRQRLTIWLGAAAAIVAIVLGAWIVTRDSNLALDTASPADIPTTVGDTGTPPASSTTAPSVDDAPGLSLAAGEIAFELPEGLVLVERGDGQLVFASSSDPTSFGETIVVVEVDSEMFRERLAELAREGMVNIGTTGVVRVNGQQFMNWTFAPLQTDPTSACGEVQGCVDLIEGVDASAIPIGIQTSVDELVSSSGAAVVVLSDTNGPLRDLVAALLEATTIS